MPKKKGLKYKIGMALIIAGIASPLLSFLVPLLGLSAAAASSAVAFLMIGLPEIFLVAGGVLAGKDALMAVKSRLFRPAGKIRYLLGVILFVSTILTNWVLVYLALTDVVLMDQESLLIIIGGLDIINVVSILMMGVEFFAKLKRIFVFEGAENI